MVSDAGRKLLAIAVVATAALVAIALTGIVSAVQVSEKLEHIEAHHVPRVRLGPDLRADLERISRAFQDAVAAQDAESLENVQVPAARRKGAGAAPERNAFESRLLQEKSD